MDIIYNVYYGNQKRITKYVIGSSKGSVDKDIPIMLDFIEEHYSIKPQYLDYEFNDNFEKLGMFEPKKLKFTSITQVYKPEEQVKLILAIQKLFGEFEITNGRYNRIRLLYQIYDLLVNNKWFVQRDDKLKNVLFAKLIEHKAEPDIDHIDYYLIELFPEYSIDATGSIHEKRQKHNLDNDEFQKIASGIYLLNDLTVVRKT